MSGLEQFLAEVRDRALLVDANLLLIKIIGDVDPRWIGTRPRTSRFSPPDYEAIDRTLANFVNFFGRPIRTTASVLTEISNLLGDFKGRERLQVFESFAAIIPLLDEIPTASRDTCRDDRFAEFGLTDVGLLRLATDGHLLLTDDGRLAALVHSRGGKVLTIETIRVLGV